tara:strand:- start:3247 stop:3531 length:285 start_codon:yes stop_codon:yes gene_type:complete
MCVVHDVAVLVCGRQQMTSNHAQFVAVQKRVKVVENVVPVRAQDWRTSHDVPVLMTELHSHGRMNTIGPHNTEDTVIKRQIGKHRSLTTLLLAQ